MEHHQGWCWTSWIHGHTFAVHVKQCSYLFLLPSNWISYS